MSEFTITLKPYVVLLVGLALGIVSGYGLFTPGGVLEDSATTEQDITDRVIAVVDARDSVSMRAFEEALYYGEVHNQMIVKYDSAQTTTDIRVGRIDSLVHTDFESLSDSVKLAFRARVLARLTR